MKIDIQNSNIPSTSANSSRFSRFKLKGKSVLATQINESVHSESPLLNLSRCKRKQQEYDEAARLATEALALAPSCPEAFHARAKALHAAGNMEAALKDLTQAVRAAPQNRDLHKILLTLKLEMKEKEGSPAPESVCSEKLSRQSVESSSGVCSETSEVSIEMDVRRATII